MSADVPEPGMARLEAASAWCLRLSEGPLASAEQRAFDAWLDEDPNNLPAFERSVGVWQRYGEASTAPEFIEVRERALATFRRRNRQRWTRRGPGWRVISSIAASIVLILLASLWYQAQPDTYRTGVGERRIVMLDDGSRVSLDAATELDVRMRRDRRELNLVSGRAKFDVAKDPLRPFSVRVGRKLVVATGTSFSVEMVNERIRVILYEGQVAVLDVPGSGKATPLRLDRRAAPADQSLKPGRELVAALDQPVAIVAPADVPRSLSWEAGQLVFNDEPLNLAVSRVNRYAAKPIILEGGVGTLQLNGVFNAGDVDAFLVGVEETLPVRVTRGTEAITISAQ
ncbi:FecR domain-containing protein [Sphingobium sp. H39-3-25]|uniref:FecR family protein n=1 Tax=Sphingobium arseniciresistens TaxID=3030834 RepID=UPI0023B96BC4|nr:FecR domain-containing protein [Sphingobium arseniciresistens]